MTILDIKTMNISKDIQRKVMIGLVLTTILFLGFTQPPFKYVGGVLFICSFLAPIIFDKLNEQKKQQASNISINTIPAATQAVVTKPLNSEAISKHSPFSESLMKEVSSLSTEGAQALMLLLLEKRDKELPYKVRKDDVSVSKLTHITSNWKPTTSTFHNLQLSSFSPTQEVNIQPKSIFINPLWPDMSGKLTPPISGIRNKPQISEQGNPQLTSSLKSNIESSNTKTKESVTITDLNGRQWVLRQPDKDNFSIQEPSDKSL